MKREQPVNRISYRRGRPPPADRLLRTEEVRQPLTPCRYRSLVVPLDGSAFGEHALPLALAIARRTRATVRLVHVHSPLKSDWFRQRGHAYLDDLMRRLAKVASVPTETVLAETNDVVVSLGKVAAASDLTVMATHQPSLLARLRSGGVGDALMRQLTTPLLLVRGFDTPVDLTGDPVPRNFLISLDGSESAERVLRPALDLGAPLGAKHTLLRVIRPVPDYSVAWGGAGTQRPVGDRMQAEAWDYFRSLAKRLGEETARVECRTLIAEQAIAGSILWYAQRRDADLIALTTRGRGHLSRVFRGSVAEQVVRRASVPVLVVRTVE